MNLSIAITLIQILGKGGHVFKKLNIQTKLACISW